MSDKQKRRWFQFHLSTAIVILFSLAYTFFLNCKANFGIPTYVFTGGFIHHLWNDQDWPNFGWPVVFYPNFSGQSPWLEPTHSVVISIVVLDSIVCGALVFGIAFLCEFIIRRREGRKP